MRAALGVSGGPPRRRPAGEPGAGAVGAAGLAGGRVPPPASAGGGGARRAALLRLARAHGRTAQRGGRRRKRHRVARRRGRRPTRGVRHHISTSAERQTQKVRRKNKIFFKYLLILLFIMYSKFTTTMTISEDFLLEIKSSKESLINLAISRFIKKS